MNKLIRDGKVAVVVSGSWSAGWSTYNQEHAEGMCMDADIAECVLNEDILGAVNIARSRYGLECDDLRYDELWVAWIDVGTRFTIVYGNPSEYVVTEQNLLFTA